MKEHYKEKFRSKTKEELLAIVEDSANYQAAAVEAAAELLQIDHDVAAPEKPLTDLGFAPDENSQGSQQQFVYFRTFSSREIWSSLCTASLLICIMWATKHVPLNGLTDWGAILIAGLLYTSTNILNHIFYKLEHKRSNGFLGGFFQLSLTTCWLYLFLALRSMSLPEIELEPSIALVFLLIMLFVAFVVEGLTQFIRNLLILLKWRVW